MTANVTIKFDTENSAFENFNHEAARILRTLADRVEYGGEGEYIPINDAYGNHVGEFNHWTE